MLQVRKYSPFVALAFGFLFTIAWIAAISWFPLYSCQQSCKCSHSQ